MNAITMIVMYLGIFGYVVYIQCARRPVTTRGLLMPVIVGAYLLLQYARHGDLSGLAVVLGAAALGVVAGLLAGQVVRVWRDGVSGVVYQAGGWRYLAVLAGLIVVRVAARVVLQHTVFASSAATLNDAFIAMAVGALLGRTVVVGARALALSGWSYAALATSSATRPLG